MSSGAARHEYGGQLEGFLDSVGRLATRPLADEAAFVADSVFYSQRQLNKLITPLDFGILKRAAKKGVMSVKAARRIFGNNSISYDCNTESIFRTQKKGLIPVEYFPFGGNGFDEYALCIGASGHCSGAWLYFFKQNRIIARHKGYNHYGLALNHYPDAQGKTVVYYTREFTSGSGIWWNNYFFYQYDNDALIPILNELQNGNLQYSWGNRIYWLESFVEKTNPLTLKMVYYAQLPDTAKPDFGPRIIDDSTLVEYTWNKKLKKLEGQYSQSKITRPQLLSYYVQPNDLLFINSYYRTIAHALHDTTTRQSTLNYLSKVRDDCHRRQLTKATK